MSQEPSFVMAIPVLVTDGLVLRPFRTGDVQLVLDASLDPLIPLITKVPARASHEQARAWIDRQHERLQSGAGYSFAIAEADTDQAVGQIGLWLHGVRAGRASIGYWVVDGHRRRGIAAEALSAVAAWGLEQLGVERLELYVEPWNEGSWRAAETVGFQREGLMRSWEAVGDQRRDMYMYSLLVSDRR